MEPDLTSIRHQLGLLCRRKGARTSAWTAEKPTQWQPNSVINPQDGQPFTDAGAWEFVADHLDSGHPITPVVLENPPGKVAYELVVSIGDSELYVKLELGSGRVIGRSFHYSERPRPSSGK
jgi:hypothetical protein